jgi:predicted DNA-binding transcriptional regulator AlpA
MHRALVFPKPFKLQNRTIAWDSKQIDRWIQQRQGQSAHR